MSDKIFENIVWNATGNFTYLAAQWVIVVLVTRKTGLENAGILSLAMSISATFQTLAFFGMRNYQVSDVKRKYVLEKLYARNYNWNYNL